jgi:hypothetical protein
MREYIVRPMAAAGGSLQSSGYPTGADVAGDIAPYDPTRIHGEEAAA